MEDCNNHFSWLVYKIFTELYIVVTIIIIKQETEYRGNRKFAQGYVVNPQ